MDICGKVRVFSHARENGGLNFTCSIGRKLESGAYENKTLNVYFTGDLKDKAQQLKANYSYELEDVIGFLSVYKEYLQVMISSARITGSKEFKEAPKQKAPTKKTKKQSEETTSDDDLPF